MRKKNHKIGGGATSPSSSVPAVGLKAIEEVSFKGLFTVRLALDEQGKRRVIPTDIADALGMDERAMRRRAHRSFPRGEAEMALPSASGVQSYRTLDLMYLPALLLGISINHVAEHLRQRLEEIREELHVALYNYTFHGVAVNEGYVNDATANERDAIAAKLRTELVPVRRASQEILERVERLPQTVEGLGMMMRSYVDQAFVEATAPLVRRIAAQEAAIFGMQETQGKLVDAFGALAVAQEQGRADILRVLAVGHDLAVDTNKLARKISTRAGTIDGEEADRIRDKVARIIEIRAAQMNVLGDRRAMQSIRADIYSDLFAYVEWGRRGQGLASMPAEKAPFAKAHLDYQLRKLLAGKPKSGASSKSATQGKLFETN